MCWSKLISDDFAGRSEQLSFHWCTRCFTTQGVFIHAHAFISGCIRVQSERRSAREGVEWAAGSISAPHTYYIHKTHIKREGKIACRLRPRERTAPAMWIESRDRCHLFTCHESRLRLSLGNKSINGLPTRETIAKYIMYLHFAPSRSHLSSRGESDAVILRRWKAAPPRKIDRCSLVRLLPAAGDREHGLHQIQGPIIPSIPYITHKKLRLLAT